MARQYTMRGVQNAAARAIDWARAQLAEKFPGSRVHDVQEDPRFQHRGVDLLCELADGSILGMEVKGDRQAHRGNYFFELVSNLERDTPGCFLYSAADWLLYAFLGTGELHALPLRETRAWFLADPKRFPLRHTQTQVGTARYTTVGAIVPARRLLAEVATAEVWRTVGQTVAFRRPSSTRRATNG